MAPPPRRHPRPTPRPAPRPARPTAARTAARPAPGTARRPAARRRPAPAPRRSSGRLRVAAALLVTAVLVLSGRLIQLQGIESGHYSELALSQRIRTVTVTALRGPIEDRAGRPLAETVDARDIYADPTLIRRAAASADAAVSADTTARPTAGQTTAVPTTASGIAARLAPVLRESTTTLVKALTGPGSFAYLARQVTPAVADAVTAMNLPGIGVLPDTRRVYPDGPLAAAVLGFVGIDGTGLAGLEYADNGVLAGHDGTEVEQVGLDGNVIPGSVRTEKPARQGDGLRLTIDSDIQWAAQQAIVNQVRATNALTGVVIVMNPRNGQILALASAPGFNPADPGASPSADLGDPAATDVYEPGSVNKVITMSAALQEGLVSPLTPITVPPTIDVAGTTFHDAEVHGYERLTLAGVLAMSSNIGTVEVAERLGAPALYRYMRAYGYGQPTGSGLPGEGSGLLPPLPTWSGTTLPTAAFGQGVGVTALQIASVYQTVANGGVRVTPSVVLGRVTPAGRLLPAPAPRRRRIISTGVATELTHMLEGVTTSLGTAPAAQIPGYQVAGKTGTANRSDGHGGYSGYTASFVGFAPATDPKLLCEVVLDRPESGIYGGVVAAPVFHQVMSYALRALHIPPEGRRMAPYPVYAGR
jgi:cell division protein FtsI (penicillin-binding protein 3)